MTWRVAAIDDETLTRAGLAAMVDARFDIIAAYPDVESFVSDPGSEGTDVVVLDLWIRPTIRSDAAKGSQAIGMIQQARPQTRILLYTSEERPAVLARLIQLGACGIVLKTDTMETLHHAIARVAAGEVVLTTSLTDLAYFCAREGKLPTLTKTQTAVLQWRARGLSYERIAAILNFSVHSVDKAICQVNRLFADFATTADLGELLDHGQPSAAAIADMLGVNVGDILDTPTSERPTSPRRLHWPFNRLRHGGTG